MEIQQLRGFHAVAKYKNFTIAAQKTLRTQPTISLQIKSLEEELGVMLFERIGPKKVNLTPEGQILLEITAPILQEIENVKSKFNEARGNYTTSSVTMATHSSVMIYLLPNIVKKFKQTYPDCQITILNRTRSEMLKMVENGEVDFGITSLETVPSNIDYKVISKFNRILIATKNHPISKKANITLEDIAKYPLIVPTQESNTRKQIDQIFQEKGLTYDIAMEVVGRTAIKTYVGMNLGLSIINEYYVTPEDKSKLFVKNLSSYFSKAETGIITRKNRLLSQPTKEFMDIIVKNSTSTTTQ
ncbi:MAG: LysR family transcriptional regulator [Proteobacteria bacterium]|nr:LysR family transcriptional regulator [Pseudomonadota bacterium]